MTQPERRKDAHHSTREMRGELNEAQQLALTQLESFGWQLKFVRHPLFQPMIPVVYDTDHKTYAVLEPDGTLNEHPSFEIRGD